jgi:hypothetical protein
LFRGRRLLLAFRRRLGPSCSVCGENNSPEQPNVIKQSST